MTENLPFVQVIIVTWNKKDDLMLLLKQLQCLRYPAERYAVVVVDNNSEDGTIESVEKSFPDVEIVQNSTNLGGAGGFNAGMLWTLRNCSDCDYLWLLDNDVLLDPDSLSELVNVLANEKNAGMCGSKIINRDDRNDVIELGAFVDYWKGDVKRNFPSEKELSAPRAVFAVDYVAACSLLVRREVVEKIGIWHKDFFIYWDDMEWGVRCNSYGYGVLAANSSVVYHPSWAGRGVDNSTIWRNYYRIRNGLCFFNNYLSGLKRRLVLLRLIIRYSCSSFLHALRAHTHLSLAIVDALKDFSKGTYGKKDFTMPPSDIAPFFSGEKDRGICLYIVDPRNAPAAKEFLSGLLKKYPEINPLLVVPWETASLWAEYCTDNVLFFNKPGSFLFIEKLRIFTFLQKKGWNLLLTGDKSLWGGIFWGRGVARINFDKKMITAVEKFTIQQGIPIFRIFFSSFFKTLFSPPSKKLLKK